MKTTYKDTFARDNLPPSESWPVMGSLDTLTEEYPSYLNCADELLDKAIESGWGDRPLFHSPNGVMTYRDLLEQANQIARVLVEDCNFISGERVLLRGPNTPMLAACWFGVLKAGGICVTTMPLLRASELSYIVDKAQIRLAICDKGWAAEIEQARAKESTLSRVLYFGQGEELNRLAEQKNVNFDSVKSRADDVALIAFTSGTSGRAKATMHFHRDVMTICDAFPRSILKANPSDVFCGTPPLAFTFGLGGLLLFPMRIGASTVLLEKADPESLARAIEKYKATITFSSPTGYRGLLSVASKFNLRSLRKGVSAGETLPLLTFQEWYRATGIQLIDGLGSTELLHIFIASEGDDIRPGSTGKAVPGYVAEIVDRDGNRLPSNTIGLLRVQGPTGCRYLGDTERQSEYVRDGWNYTGDAYLQDDDGYFWFQGRADDMIISSGYNIAGPEVENALLSHPQVKECGVVGVPDLNRGQIVKAFVVLESTVNSPSPTIGDLQEHVKRVIAPYKYPRSIEFVASLPRTETGKLQRFRLRQ